MSEIKPSYYNELGNYSPVHVIQKWQVGFLLGNALKYIQRAGKKDQEKEITDLKKATWYIQRRIYELDPDNELDPSL